MKKRRFYVMRLVNPTRTMKEALTNRNKLVSEAFNIALNEERRVED